MTLIVVGGGATGVGVARDLALRGLDVTLVERDGLSAGTTGRSHGVLHSGARYADTDPEGAIECLEENRILGDIAGECIDRTGGYFLQCPGDPDDYFADKRAACEEVGIPTEVMSGDELREAEPGVAEDVERALAVPDAVVYPSRLVAATAADARDHGATIELDAPVADLKTVGGQVTGVELADGRELDASHVVNAAGAWAGKIAEMAGVDVRMRPSKGAMAVLDADCGAVLNRCRPASDGDIVVPHGERVVAGTTSEEVDDPDDYPREDSEIERVVAECADMLPELAGAEIERVYWGVRPLYRPPESGGNVGSSRAISRGFYLLDHRERDGLSGLSTIVGGKLTTYRRMAEATADLVCDRLGVDAASRTGEERLPGADDAARLDELVAEFRARSPADADVTT